MIRFENVSFSYLKDEPILNETKLKVPPGLSLLLGPNGCGKSTLLKLASGVEKPDSGKISIDGHDLWEDEVAARQNITYLPEQPDLTPYATLKEILDLTCRLRGEPLEKGNEALKFFDLQNLADRTVRELSMGQRRRAVFAAALIGTPNHLLLDEPLEAMDRNIQKEIISWISLPVNDGKVVVVASHSIEPFIDLVSQAIMIRSGKAEIIKELPGAPEQKLSFLDRLAKK